MSETTEINVLPKFWLIVAICVFFALFMAWEAEKKADRSNELKANAAETEALTYDYRIESVQEGRYKRNRQIVSYIYFHDNQEFKFRRTLGSVGDRFERFKKPLVFRLIYSKNNPRIHELVLTYSLDSMTNKQLENFALSYFNVPTIQAFYKIQSSE
jgi:hypothetical protein